MGILSKEGFTVKLALQVALHCSRAGALLFGSSEEARGAGSEPGSVSERGGQALQCQALVGIMGSREGCVYGPA